MARVEELKVTLAENTQNLVSRELAREVIKEEKAHIRNVEHRVARQNETWLALQAIKNARAAAAIVHGVEVPGADTGLIDAKGNVDTDLLTQINQVEDLTARELGQRAENQGTASINIALLVPGMTANVQNTPTATTLGTGEISAAESIIDITATR